MNYEVPKILEELPQGTGVCPQCGCTSIRRGVWPWYLGTIGAIAIKPAVCNQCECKFDLNKPTADYKKRMMNMALAINGIGCLGILAVIGALGVMIANMR